ncbi:hypothetical protein [Hoeflea sp.]|uniref:hypothetical protein n=1 Tax=Hoeflea sp. TaxID=1940281 RepID=UPI003F4AE2DF
MPLFLLALGVALPLMLFDIVDGVNFLGDIDDDLRAVQIRLLAAGGAWFDRTIPMIEMPEAYVSPWSRLVDLPYVAITWLLTPVLGMETALQAAFWIWPPVMLVLFCGLVVRTLMAMLDGFMPLEPIGVIGSVLLMWLALWEFSPGRIDHHNVQLLLIMLTFCGLGLWTPKGALLVGVGCAGSVAVGLELLPLIALVLGGVSLCWVLDRPGSRAFALALGLSMLAVTPLFGLALIGPAGLASTQCDALSAPYALALAGYGGVTAALAALPVRTGMIGRGVLVAVAGAALVGLLAWQFPLCLDGPYHMIDPLSRTYWLDRVEQEKSFLLYFQNGKTAELIVLGALVAITALAAPVVGSTIRNGRSGVIIIYACAVAALALALLQTRYIRFPAALVPLFVPFALHMVSRDTKAGARLLGAVVAVVAGAGLALQALAPAPSDSIDAVDYLTYAGCKQPDVSILGEVKPGRIMTPAWLGLRLLDHLPPGMTVAAVSFHRAAPGMRRILQSFISDDSQTRREALDGFDYIALCRLPVPASIAADNLFTVVARGGNWPGLTRLSGAENEFMLFEIDHAALR